LVNIRVVFLKEHHIIILGPQVVLKARDVFLELRIDSEVRLTRVIHDPLSELFKVHAMRMVLEKLSDK
jgi:hypothetical protein